MMLKQLRSSCHPDSFGLAQDRLRGGIYANYAMAITRMDPSAKPVLSKAEGVGMTVPAGLFIIAVISSEVFGAEKSMRTTSWQ